MTPFEFRAGEVENHPSSTILVDPDSIVFIRAEPEHPRWCVGLSSGEELSVTKKAVFDRVLLAWRSK